MTAAQATYCGPSSGAVECKDLKIVRSDKVPLGDADRANGVAEKWHMQVTYLWKPTVAADWQGRAGFVWVEKRGSAWRQYNPLIP
jgi:hypothetical protein